MQDLFDMLDDITIRPYVDGKRYTTSFHPSGCSIEYEKQGKKIVEGTCQRQTWYNMKNFPVTGVTSPELKDMQEIGDYFSARFVDKFKRLGLYVGDEVSFQYEGISGRVDIIIKDPYKAPKPPQRPSPEHLLGVEIKSVGGYFATKGTIISTKDTPLKPKLSHVMQCMIYLDYYSKFGITQWLIFYIDRSSMQKAWHKVTLNGQGNPVIVNKELTETWTHITLKGIKDRFKTVQDYLDKNLIPPRDYQLQYPNSKLILMAQAGEMSKTDAEKVLKQVAKKAIKKEVITDDQPPIIQKGDFNCNYCSYKEICWSDTPDKPITTRPVQVVCTEPEEAEGFL